MGDFNRKLKDELPAGETLNIAGGESIDREVQIRLFANL